MIAASRPRWNLVWIQDFLGRPFKDEHDQGLRCGGPDGFGNWNPVPIPARITGLRIRSYFRA